MWSEADNAPDSVRTYAQQGSSRQDRDPSFDADSWRAAPRGIGLRAVRAARLTEIGRRCLHMTRCSAACWPRSTATLPRGWRERKPSPSWLRRRRSGDHSSWRVLRPCKSVGRTVIWRFFSGVGQGLDDRLPTNHDEDGHSDAATLLPGGRSASDRCTVQLVEQGRMAAPGRVPPEGEGAVSRRST